MVWRATNWRHDRKKKNEIWSVEALPCRFLLFFVVFLCFIVNDISREAKGDSTIAATMQSIGWCAFIFMIVFPLRKITAKHSIEHTLALFPAKNGDNDKMTNDAPCTTLMLFTQRSARHCAPFPQYFDWPIANLCGKRELSASLWTVSSIIRAERCTIIQDDKEGKSKPSNQLNSTAIASEVDLFIKDLIFLHDLNSFYHKHIVEQSWNWTVQ